MIAIETIELKQQNIKTKKYIKNDEILISLLDIEKTIEKFGNFHNNDIDKLLLSEITSRKMAAWKCSIGHTWEDKITNVNNKRECPYCAGKYLLEGVNDLQTLNPQFITEWHPILNKELLPSMVSYKNKKSVWWLCEKGHKWKCKISRRHEGAKCPICAKQEKFKLNIYIAYFYIKKYYKDTILNYRDKTLLKNFKINVFVPSLKIGIEYDEKSGIDVKTTSLHKNDICLKNGIKLIRIRDVCLRSTVLMDSSIDYQRSSQDYVDYESILKKILIRHFDIKDPVVDIKKDLPEIYKLLNSNPKPVKKSNTKKDTIKKPKKNRLIDVDKKLLSEWNNKKNKDLKPYMFAMFSDQKVWWKCSLCGHEWEEKIYSRTRKTKLKCPVCGVH